MGTGIILSMAMKNKNPPQNAQTLSRPTMDEDGRSDSGLVGIACPATPAAVLAVPHVALRFSLPMLAACALAQYCRSSEGESGVVLSKRHGETDADWVRAISERRALMYYPTVTAEIAAKNAHLSTAEIEKDLADTQAEVVSFTAEAAALEQLAEASTVERERKMAAFRASAKRESIKRRAAFAVFLQQLLTFRAQEGPDVTRTTD